CDWIVLDGYQFSGAYQKWLKDRGCKLLCIDDHVHASRYYADCVLNPNAYARRALYQHSEANSCLLLGARYLLLRREFRDYAHRQERAAARHASRLLITLGGSDPRNVTAAVLEALRFLSDPDLEIRLVVGGSNPNLVALTGSAASLPLHVEIVRD